MMGGYWTAVVIPLWQSYIEEKNRRTLGLSLNLSSFRRVLEDPKLLKEFKEFCIKDFTVENVLFYEEITELKKEAYAIIAEQQQSTGRATPRFKSFHPLDKVEKSVDETNNNKKPKQQVVKPSGAIHQQLSVPEPTAPRASIDSSKSELRNLVMVNNAAMLAMRDGERDITPTPTPTPALSSLPPSQQQQQQSQLISMSPTPSIDIEPVESGSRSGSEVGSSTTTIGTVTLPRHHSDHDEDFDGSITRPVPSTETTNTIQVRGPGAVSGYLGIVGSGNVRVGGGGVSVNTFGSLNRQGDVAGGDPVPVSATTLTTPTSTLGRRSGASSRANVNAVEVEANETRVPDSLKETFRSIFVLFVEERVAPLEINLAAGVREKIKAKVEAGVFTVEMYDEALSVVVDSMFYDSFPKFKNSVKF
ncbi:hypothetical protein HDU76_005162 [Blyttiomyces sp. JEL0837]|nr:hypothetical protein HDU76_005162 [Blyttiomyces sp. JEL0837]